MFCPKCGTENIADAKFCRGCGENISLVPQAMTGHLPETESDHENVVGVSWDAGGRRQRHKGGKPRLDKAVANLFTGLGFVVVAAMVFLFAPAGRIWWFWMLIPAFSMLGGGVAEYVRYKQSQGEEPKLPGINSRKEMPPARVSAIPPRRNNTAELATPPSVTEGTTRHLDMSAEAPTRHIGRNDE